MLLPELPNKVSLRGYLGISERLVKARLASIYNKFGVDSRAATIAVAAQYDLLSGLDE